MDNFSDNIFILTNFYRELDITREDIIKETKQISSLNNRISRVRYKDYDNTNKWLALDNGGDISELSQITNPLSIHTTADNRELQSTSERLFLEKFKDSGDTHVHFQSYEFVKQHKILSTFESYIMNILDIDSRKDFCWVLFDWANPEMCSWHIDGSNTYKVSNITNPPKLTINISLGDTSYVELKKQNGQVVSNEADRHELCLFNQFERSHRIVLNKDVKRNTLAFRIRNVQFDNIITKLLQKNKIKKIL